MADLPKLPQLKKFLSEDYPDQKSWIGRFFLPLNDYMTSAYLLLKALREQASPGSSSSSGVNNANVITTSTKVDGSSNTYFIDPTSGNVTITLPRAAEAIGSTLEFIISASLLTNSAIITPYGTETINGLTSITLNQAYSSLKLSALNDKWVGSIAAPMVECCAYRGTSAQTITKDAAAAVIGFNMVRKDTHSGLNTSTGIYTVKANGEYSVEYAALVYSLTSVPNSVYCSIYKNSSSTALGLSYRSDLTVNKNATFTGFAILSCVVGDTISVKAFAGGQNAYINYDDTNDLTYVYIQKTGGY